MIKIPVSLFVRMIALLSKAREDALKQCMFTDAGEISRLLKDVQEQTKSES